MTDILIDTNILLHADNPQERTQRWCLDLINYLLVSDESLCIDEAVDTNRSMILNEYYRKLRTPETTGKNFLKKMLQQKRIVPKSRSCEHRVTRIINQHIKKDKPVDRLFLRVTANSEDKNLVSHDYEDYQLDKREFFRRSININIRCAEEMLTILNNQ